MLGMPCHLLKLTALNCMLYENSNAMIIYTYLARTPDIGQGWKDGPTDYCGLRTTTLFHDILILP